MPRRKSQTDEPMNRNEAPPLMLTTRAVTGHHREHQIDAYETAPGAVPAKITNISIKSAPIKRKLTSSELATRDEARIELRARARRYTRYLDAMSANGGYQDEAIAEVMGISIAEAREHLAELHAEIRTGIGGTDLADTFERNDLSMAARASILRKHMFSDNPAASLKAVQMVGEIEGTAGAGYGSFEQFLRLARGQKE